jgi:hypothetical protein
MVMATKSSCCTNSRSSQKKTEEGGKEKSFRGYKVDFQLAKAAITTLERTDHCAEVIRGIG